MSANKTGLPDKLKSGMESLSGMSLDHVKVHYNSPKPAAVQAHAYTQGSEIHLASGQERHLAHELAHVVQQAQGRVKPTMQIDGVSEVIQVSTPGSQNGSFHRKAPTGAIIVNDSALEKEAAAMGAKALQK